MSKCRSIDDCPRGRRDAPTFDALRLAVLWRAKRNELELLSLMSGISVSVLQHFADTGEISTGDRARLEVYQ